MASLSSSPSASVLTSRSWKYHVFLSFRGKDTRKTIVDHLYTALDQKGISTYKDDITLPRGEWIGPSLLKAIEESQIAIVVFSKNYADSLWCLQELAHIMKCKDRGQIQVFPLFYGVSPSDLRTEAMSEHELENLESCRKALEDASVISGWVTKDMCNGNESDIIKKIIVDISPKLQLVVSSVNENLIGIEARKKLLRAKLQISLSGVCMIGIWGVGGGGKTTLASSIYDEISSEFDGCCFVENIRVESSKKGLKYLQEKIICGVLKQKQVEVGRVEEGRRMIRDRLHDKKVLIVLDDVDNLVHLEELAGSRDWFGEGSRIIITARNEHVLTGHKVDVIQKISLLNNDEAIELFHKHAPRDRRHLEDYLRLSKDVVSYAGGLPLALTIFGRFLRNKNIIEWKSALARWKEKPDADILDKLKVSYDGLTNYEKELFLDIACFFRTMDKDRAMKTLDACGFHPVIGVKVLIQKALITITTDGKFEMHDLVQEMGHYIVRGEHPKKPEKHSRVWKKEDVLRFCAMDATKELDIIEAIRFKHTRVDLLQRLPQIVSNMKNVRWIDWEGDLASPLPTNFSPMELCCLQLDGISQKTLWEGHKLLLNLKMMELYGLHNLIVTPNFKELPNLQRFKLTKCRYLEEIHPSIGCLESLGFLSIKFCFGLKMFPQITQLEKLETLSFSRCPKLFKLSQIQQQNLKLIGLLLSRTCLRKLDLSYCDLEDEDIRSVVWELPNLRKLNLTANKFSKLNFSLLHLPQLEWLNISHCERLVELSELPSSLAVLVADYCTSLDTFGDVLNCKLLWNFSHRKGNKLGGDILLTSMLQVNAIEDHFISVALEHPDPKGFLGRLFRGKTNKLHLPHNWYKDYCGIRIYFVTDMKSPRISILIKQEVDEDSRFKLRPQNNYEAVEHQYDGTTMSVGYVPFNSLRQEHNCEALSTSSYNIISLFIKDRFSDSKEAECYVKAELVRRESENDQEQGTKDAADCSESWDGERKLGNTFMIEHESESSIKIQWFPYDKQKSDRENGARSSQIEPTSDKPSIPTTWKVYKRRKHNESHA